MSPDIDGFKSDFDAIFHARSYLGDLPPPYSSASFSTNSTEGKDKSTLSPFTSFGPDELSRYLKDVFMPEDQTVVLQDEDYDALVKMLKGMLAWKPEERMTAKQALNSAFLRKERIYEPE